jgi:RNA polymerase sigma-70 factor (ECF subfamily)
MSALRDLAGFFAVEGPRLRCFLRRYWPGVSADDIAQDSFERLCSVNPDTVSSPRAYLFRTARNLAINERKRAACVNFELVGDPEALAAAPDGADPEQQVIADEMVARLHEALDRLPERQRLSVVLFKLEGWSYKEIGERLGVSPRTVERYVATGLAGCNAFFKARMTADEL